MNNRPQCVPHRSAIRPPASLPRDRSTSLAPLAQTLNNRSHHDSGTRQKRNGKNKRQPAKSSRALDDHRNFDSIDGQKVSWRSRALGLSKGSVAKNMRKPWWSLYLLAICMLGLDSKLVGEAFQPEFAEPITNLTVPVGRDATFRCLVQNLGGYRVGWVKADTKAIQAIHVHVITNNHRVGVSHNGQAVWNLHIRNVQEEDQGQYMCQINTDPMKSQMGYLEVVIPPDFIAEETSGDVMVPEGGTAKVSCRAKGMPVPRIMWRREDGADIVIRDSQGSKTKVQVYEEEVLTLTKISRSDMGAYLCIASNGVPPSVSKRIQIKVHFHPVIQVPNQLVGAPFGTDVTLECYVESSPKSINYWVRDSNEMLISSGKYEVLNTVISSFESRMAVTIRALSAKDVGGYRCVAKNSLGEVDSVIRLYEIPGSTIKNTSPAVKKEDYKYSTPIEGPDNQFGSADRSDDEDERDADEVSPRPPNLPKMNNATKNRTNIISNAAKEIIDLVEKGQFGVQNSASGSTYVYHTIIFIMFYHLSLSGM